MRPLMAAAALFLFTPLGVALEEADVLFFAPFEDHANATVSVGAGDAQLTGAPRFDAGKRGRAVVLDADSLLTYAFKGNVAPSEGTVMLWFKPEWPADDDKFHYLFRAATGNHGGKALNALMLYKYPRWGRLMMYASDGQPTGPSEGRSIAGRDDMTWQPGAWQHVAATWSATLASTEMYLYLNGERVSACGGAVFVPDEAPATFDLGGPKGAGATWLDDMLVFSRPLLPKEIRGIYDAYGGEGPVSPGDLPFVSSRELQLRAHVLHRNGELLVEADFRGARQDLKDQTGSVEVEVVAGDRRLTERAPTVEHGVNRLIFDCARVGAGRVEVRATLRDRDGAVLRTGHLTYDVPPPPPWLGNTLGKTPGVLPPWTPLQVDQWSVRMWGREYQFQGSPLPTQVVTQGRSVLRSPVSLSLRSGDQAAALVATPSGSPSGDGAASRRLWQGTVGSLQCEVSSLVEFDGFMLLEVDLRPTDPVEVDSLELVVPLAQSAATLYHHCNGEWTALSDAGAVGPAGWSKSLPFVPYVWLGTETGGLAWFCESNWNWRNADPDRALEIIHGEDGVDLRIRFLDQKVTVTNPLRLTFGFMATPVKPMPARWRDWRPMFISALNLDAFAASDWDRPGCRNIGVLWNNHVGSFSYLPAEPAEMRRKVALLRDNGWDTMVSYYALNQTQTGTPDYAIAEREWRRSPYGEQTCPYGTHATVCAASSWADMLLWVIDKTLDETGTDGVYLDCSNPDLCRSPEHGCAPGRYPLLATRELQKRIYALVRKKRGEQGFVYSHVSENNLLTTFSFADVVLNGEQYNRKDLRTLTLEKFRAELSPQPYGVPALLLPTLVKFQPDKQQEKMPGAEFLAFPLLHDVICLPSWMSRESQQLLKKIQGFMREFGVAEAEFLPYWSNQEHLGVTPAEALVSAYWREDQSRALLLARGPGRPALLKVAPRGRLAPLRMRSARNLLTGASLTWNADRLSWPLPDGSVQLAIVE